MFKKILFLSTTCSLTLFIALNSLLLTKTHTPTAWASDHHSLSSSDVGNRAETAHQPMITPTLVTTETPLPAETPAEISTETPSHTPVPIDTPTMAPTSTPGWVCVNPLDNVSVSNPTVSVEDTFTINRDVVHGSIMDMRVTSIAQDEDNPIVEAVDEGVNQYRALRTGTVTMTVDLDSEEYCTAGDSGSGYFAWVYSSADVLVTIIESPAITPTATPVDESEALQQSQHRIYLPFAQR